MGGYGSGRTGGRPTVEDGLTLDLSRLMKLRQLVPGCNCSGTLTWTETRTGMKVGSVGYQAQLAAERGRLRLHYTNTRRSGEKQDADYWIELETTPQPLGGRRWWFVCPKLGIRAAKLHLPSGALTFASRKAYRLGYRSQRETATDRAYSRAFNLRYKLGARGGIGDPVIRPKGMHRATFAREMAEVEDAETVCNLNLIAAARRLGVKV